jgi:hypothetical protein
MSSFLSNLLNNNVQCCLHVFVEIIMICRDNDVSGAVCRGGKRSSNKFSLASKFKDNDMSELKIIRVHVKET